MKKTLLSHEHFKVMPWKNGAGVTAEIAIHPPGADFRKADFSWRVSSAQIQNENKFSKFPGYDRVLTVLSGEGLLLNNAELGPFEIFEFHGEEDIECSLIDGPVEDLNIIFQREKFRCTLQLINVTESLSLSLEAGVHFLMPLQGAVNAAGSDVEPAQFLQIENSQDQKIVLKSDSEPVPVLQISLIEALLQ